MALDPVTVGLMGEGVKLGFQLLFTQLRMMGKTPEEIDSLFFQEKSEFFSNHPTLMEDV